MDDVTALVCVDVQRDFLPGGALGVPGGDAVVAALVAFAGQHPQMPVVATRDLHPADHRSFASQRPAGLAETAREEWQYRWPDHCVEGSEGVEIHPAVAAIAGRTVSKGRDRDAEQYSAFEGGALGELLRAEGVTRLVVGGLATDYCVRATVLDALAEGFAVELLLPACRAVDVHPGDGRRAIEEMLTAGATVR